MYDYFDYLVREEVIIKVFKKLILDNKIKYKAYLAYYYLDFKRTFFDDSKKYKPRKIKWCKRYLKKHNLSMKYFDELIDIEIKKRYQFLDELKKINSCFSNLINVLDKV